MDNLTPDQMRHWHMLALLDDTQRREVSDFAQELLRIQVEANNSAPSEVPHSTNVIPFRRPSS